MNAELCAQVSNYLFEIQITLSNVLVLPVCFSPISSGRDSLEIDDHILPSTNQISTI